MITPFYALHRQCETRADFFRRLYCALDDVTDDINGLTGNTGGGIDGVGDGIADQRDNLGLDLIQPLQTADDAALHGITHATGHPAHAGRYATPGRCDCRGFFLFTILFCHDYLLISKIHTNPDTLPQINRIDFPASIIFVAPFTRTNTRHASSGDRGWAGRIYGVSRLAHPALGLFVMRQCC